MATTVLSLSDSYPPELKDTKFKVDLVSLNQCVVTIGLTVLKDNFVTLVEDLG